MSADLSFFVEFICVVVCVLTVTAEELWKGVLAETGAGARKGRGKRTKRKLRRDLNRGQRIGEGKIMSLCPSGVCLWFSLCKNLCIMSC